MKTLTKNTYQETLKAIKAEIGKGKKMIEDTCRRQDTLYNYIY